jgi:demethylmenaquinone methyltransferase/2-methoxy-6-polyprenyl-1,4-benzoquinol methylase
VIGQAVRVDRLDAGAVLCEQREYYDARASEYDDAYRRTALHDRGEELNADWQAEMARLVGAFARLPLAGDIVELAAGTGMWTERLVGRARSLTVIDGSAAMLAVNRGRLGPASERVQYEVADLLEWQAPRVWDACVFGFWLCHVPDDRVASFLRTVARSLRRGGAVCVIEKAANSDATSEHMVRMLNDGREFTIIDHPRPPETVVGAFADAGLTVAIETIGTRFCIGYGTKL